MEENPGIAKKAAIARGAGVDRNTVIKYYDDIMSELQQERLSTALQPFTSTVDGSFTPLEDSEVAFLRGKLQINKKHLQKKLLREISFLMK